MTRRAGLLMPLFSAVSSAGCGIGELSDVAPLSDWMAAAGFTRLMLLPIGTMADGQASPYSASSALAIDPIYIGLTRLEDFERAGGTAALSSEAVHALAAARASDRVRHDDVRRVKREGLEIAFARFLHDEWESLTPRAAALAGYIARERWWLDDYALFQAIAASQARAPWWEWPGPLRDRDPAALGAARRDLARDVLAHQYLQWIAESEWQSARRHARERGVTVIGDLPFMVDAHSADVWARSEEFLLDVSAGAPPDAFSETGQDWGLPTYHWSVIARTDYAWLRQRARRLAALFDGFRVDHLVGFFRTYGKPRSGAPYFSPWQEHEQLAQGERILALFQESGAEVMAEDLGTVPDFVRDALARARVPGCKVMRWERAWHEWGQPFVEPARYPAVSFAVTGTHDTEPLAVWWANASVGERTAVLAMPALQAHGPFSTDEPWSPRLRDALLAVAYGAASRDLFVPMNDLFGWTDRINTPATVNSENWTWRSPWPVDRLTEVPEAAERARFSRTLAQQTGRLHAPDAAHG